MEGMDLRSRRNISVCVRIRPLIEQELRKRDTQAVWAATRGFLRYNPPGRPPTSPSRNVIEAGNFDNASSDDPQMYPFDDVFGPESSTREVYDRVCRDSVRSVIDGFNSAICAYGQTSSGKTHTILGSQQRKGDEPCEGGMLFHACSDLFKFIQTESLREPERHFELSMSYLEIYQEQLTDLLNGKDIRQYKENEAKNEAKNEPSSDTPHTPRFLKHTHVTASQFASSKNARESRRSAEAVTKLPVRSFEDVQMAVCAGERRRHYETTKMNDRSSRSHTVVHFVLESQCINESRVPAAPLSARSPSTSSASHRPPSASSTKKVKHEGVRVSHLYVVDLAGSERLDMTDSRPCSEMVLSQAVSINKSLFNLQRVVRLLSSGKQPDHVPYRDSKLTWLLRPALSGDFYANFICCVTPAQNHYYQTRSTVQFAMRAKEIKLTEVIGEWDKRKYQALRERFPVEQQTLIAMWDRIEMPPAERQRCRAAFTRDPNQQALEEVLAEQARIQARHDRLGPVLDEIREYENIKVEKAKFDKYASNKQRLLDRRTDSARLLKEEQMRKYYDAEAQRLEEALQWHIHEYECEAFEEVWFNGKRYMDELTAGLEKNAPAARPRSTKREKEADEMAKMFPMFAKREAKRSSPQGVRR